MPTEYTDDILSHALFAAGFNAGDHVEIVWMQDIRKMRETE